MRPGEFDLIARYFAPLAAGFPGAAGLKDDLAVVRPSSGCELATTVDAMVEGVHFLSDDPPDTIARKVLRANLSDLAAAGARPLCYFLSMSLNNSVDEVWVSQFAAGLADDQKEFGISLAGGDTTSTPGPVTLSVTAMGEVEQGRAVRRSGSGTNDDVWVTGTIGDAANALHLIKNYGVRKVSEEYPFLLDRYRLPVPRSALGPRLVGLVSAMTDISDGLVADLGHICAASGTGAELSFYDIPLSDDVREFLGKEEKGVESCAIRILSGGDDYELLFTAPTASAPLIEKAARLSAVRVARIGNIVSGDGVRVVSADGAEIEVAAGGWRHF
jgi:thiamine-monophosphate kinase